MIKKIILSVMLLFVTHVSYAATLAEDDVKAAFIYHFLNFIQWEDGRPEYNVCIPDDKSLRDVTRKTLAGKYVNDRQIDVLENADVCHILVSNYYTASSTPMLTIGELDKGALLEFRTIKNKLKFAVNLDKIKNSHLKISSQLLKLAISE